MSKDCTVLLKDIVKSGLVSGMTHDYYSKSHTIHHSKRKRKMAPTYPNKVETTIIKKLNKKTKCVELHKNNGSVMTLPPQFTLSSTYLCQKCCRWFELKVDHIRHKNLFHKIS